MHKIPSFFAAAPTSKTSTLTASTDSSGSPAKNKSKPTDCINEEIATVISWSAKSDKADKIASAISGSAKSNEAEEVASAISGSTKSDEAEEEGIAHLVIEDFALDEESKTPPPDPSRLEANRKQIEILGLMRTISNKNAATLDITCPLPSLFNQCAQWFIRLPDLVKKTLRNKKPPQPFIIFDIENACERYPGKSNKELETLSKEDLYKVDILAFCPTKSNGAGNLMSLVKGSYSKLSALTGTHVIQNGSFLVDKWDPAKEGTKQLHEINIENKMESLKRIADIANLSKDMSELTRREKISAMKIRMNDQSWNANFAMLVEYVGENFKLPDQRKSKVGMWYVMKGIIHIPLTGEFAYRVWRQ
jgi:hypothetical protein